MSIARFVSSTRIRPTDRPSAMQLVTAAGGKELWRTLLLRHNPLGLCLRKIDKGAERRLQVPTASIIKERSRKALQPRFEYRLPTGSNHIFPVGSRETTGLGPKVRDRRRQASRGAGFPHITDSLHSLVFKTRAWWQLACDVSQRRAEWTTETKGGECPHPCVLFRDLRPLREPLGSRSTAITFHRFDGDQLRSGAVLLRRSWRSRCF